MLKVKNLNKRFGDIVALKDLSFDVEKGDFIFIVGPSGSGKTTLINIILGKISPDSGEVVFEGKKIDNLDEKSLPEVRQKIGVIFQDFKVLPERTVRENVEVALAVKGVNEDEWKKRVDQVLELVGLSERAELFPSQLSGGELQRVSLARALVIDPDLILADEPTGNLDWETADEIVSLLEKINKEGKSIIMATHHKVIVERLKKKTIELERYEKEEKKPKEKKKNDKEAKIKKEEKNG